MSDIAADSERITRDTLEDALKHLQGDIDRDAPSVLVKAAWVAAAVAVALILLSYLLGRRTGRKHSTIVEIRRL